MTTSSHARTIDRFGTALSRRSTLRIAGTGLLGALGGAAHAAAARSQAATPVTADDGLPADLQLQLATIVLSTLAETYTPGALVGVWMPGRAAWRFAAGVGDIANAAPLRQDDHFRIASITKTFVATVALQLVAEGKLAIDDTLATFVDGIPNGDAITLRDLLGMTSGVYNYINDPLIAVDYDKNPLLPFRPEQAVEIVRRHGEADFAPGAKFVYSDTNYILVGLIIEKVTGRDLATEVTVRTIVPLGLTGTSFATTPQIPDPYLRGYSSTKPGAALRDVTASNPTVAWAAGAMISTLDDLRRWNTELLTGTLLTPALQAERRRITYAVTTPITFGYGLGLAEVGGLIGHSGGILGYSSWMIQDPGSGTTIVLVANLGNTEGGLGGVLLFERIADLLFPGRGFDALIAETLASAGS